MESWTEQAGYPLLTMTREGEYISVKQERSILINIKFHLFVNG